MRRKERGAADRLRAELAINLLASAMDISTDEIGGDGRSAKAVFARQVAMYIANAGFGMSYARVGAAMGRDRTTVAHACRIVESKRDEPEFDRWVEALEFTASNAPVIS